MNNDFLKGKKTFLAFIGLVVNVVLVYVGIIPAEVGLGLLKPILELLGVYGIAMKLFRK